MTKEIIIDELQYAQSELVMAQDTLTALINAIKHDQQQRTFEIICDSLEDYLHKERAFNQTIIGFNAKYLFDEIKNYFDEKEFDSMSADEKHLAVTRQSEPTAVDLIED